MPSFTGKRIRLVSAHNQYLGARPDGSLCATTNCGDSEIWSVDDAGQGDVFLRSDQGTLVAANDTGGLFTTRVLGNWERWRIEDAPGGRFLLTSKSHGTHLGARPDGGLYAHANALAY